MSFFSRAKMRVKKTFKKLIRHAKKYRKNLDKTVVLSLGANCLADDILSRNGLKSFSSPYASARSNIEYILGFEKEKFADFLNPEFLVKESFDVDTVVVRNKKYSDLRNRYHATVSNGFEFTHHDVLDNQTFRETLQRRCERMLHLKGKRLVFLYHHRLCNETDPDLLIHHLQQLAEIYRSRGNSVSIYLFMQHIIADPEARRIEYHRVNDINFFEFYTLKEWAGNDTDVLWAKCDDDLINEMIQHIKHSIKTHEGA